MSRWTSAKRVSQGRKGCVGVRLWRTTSQRFQGRHVFAQRWKSAFMFGHTQLGHERESCQMIITGLHNQKCTSRPLKRQLRIIPLGSCDILRMSRAKESQWQSLDKKYLHLHWGYLSQNEYKELTRRQMPSSVSSVTITGCCFPRRRNPEACSLSRCHIFVLAINSGRAAWQHRGSVSEVLFRISAWCCHTEKNEIGHPSCSAEQLAQQVRPKVKP